MAFFKEIWTFVQGASGFREVYYSEADNLSDAAQFPSGLVQASLSFRSPLTVLAKIAVSSVLNNRVSVVVNVNQPGRRSKDNSPDLVGASAIYTLNSPAKGFRRQVWFRGLCDVDVLRDASTGVNTPSEVLANAMRNYVAKLVQYNYRVRGYLKVTEAGYNWNNISRADKNLQGGTAVFGLLPAGLAAGDQVNITQVSPKLLPGLDGVWTVQGLVTGGFVIDYAMPNNQATIAVTKGRFRRVGYDYGAIDQATSAFNKFGTRDTGRNPTAGRGRKPAVRLRSA